MLRERYPSYAYVDRPYIKRGLKPAGKKVALRLSKEASYLLINELITLGQDMIVQELDPESIRKRLGDEFLEGKGYRIVPFYIACPVETAIQRDIERDAKTVGEEGVRRIHDGYAQPHPYEIVIETDNASVEDCIYRMISSIENGPTCPSTCPYPS